MRNLTGRLENFISSANGKRKENALSVKEERLFRSLKTQGERAVKGREVTKTVFESKFRDSVSFLMIMEGRHSMSVGSQVARRFEESAMVEAVEVVKTKRGACVVVRPAGEDA